ncbi:MAG: efflux RND transporter periplasmic adaptor subunit [Sedimentisphaerales bacterium]
MKLKIISLTIILLLIGLIFFGCRVKKQDPVEQPAVWVTAAKAVSQDVPVYIDEIGSCAAYEIVAIRAQASGQIVDINFTDGADVKKGDLLFTIDPRPYEAALKQAQASLVQSKAALELAKSEYERAKGLLPTGAMSKEGYDIKQNAVIVGEAKIQADQAAIQVAQTNLDYCYIHSPIDGRAGQRCVDAGNVVIANNSGNDVGAVLLTIHRLDPIYVDFTVTEQELELVRQEMAKGNLKTLVHMPNKPDEAREGTLTFLDNAVREETGTIKLRATLPNKNHYFWPGQFVQVRLVLSVEKNAVLVPSQAVQNSQNGQFVYVIKPNQTVEMRPVTPQRALDGQTVVKGIEPQETVVTDGHLRLSPGAKVQIKQSSNSEAVRQ